MGAGGQGQWQRQHLLGMEWWAEAAAEAEAATAGAFATRAAMMVARLALEEMLRLAATQAAAQWHGVTHQ